MRYEFKGDACLMVDLMRMRKEAVEDRARARSVFSGSAVFAAISAAAGIAVEVAVVIGAIAEERSVRSLIVGAAALGAAACAGLISVKSGHDAAVQGQIIAQIDIQQATLEAAHATQPPRQLP